MHLLESDPETYSWADLERDGRTAWDGVRKLERPIGLAAFKARFPTFDPVRISRLSVMPVPGDVRAFVETYLH